MRKFILSLALIVACVLSASAKSFVLTLKDGTKVFSPVPMSFHGQDGLIMPYWADFYSRRLMEVPEGVPGSHPAGLSRSSQVRIKYEWKGFVK